MLLFFISLFLSVFSVFADSNDFMTHDPTGYRLDISQYQPNFVGSWLYVGVGFEQISHEHELVGYKIAKNLPIQAIAKFGLRYHTSTEFALDICAQIDDSQKSAHKFLSELNFLFFIQTSYDEIPTYYLGIGGPVHIRSILKSLHPINLKELSFSNFVFGKRIDAKKFIQLKVHDFRRLGYKKQNFYCPSLEKLVSNSMIEIGVGF